VPASALALRIANGHPDVIIAVVADRAPGRSRSNPRICSALAACKKVVGGAQGSCVLPSSRDDGRKNRRPPVGYFGGIFRPEMCFAIGLWSNTLTFKSLYTIKHSVCQISQNLFDIRAGAL
jgi:hypothetical protein